MHVCVCKTMYVLHTLVIVPLKSVTREMRTFSSPSHLRFCLVPLRNISNLLPKTPEYAAAWIEITSLDGMLESLKPCLQISAIGIG